MSDGFGGDFLALGEPWELETGIILTAEGGTYYLTGTNTSLSGTRDREISVPPYKTPFYNQTEARTPEYEYIDLQLNVMDVFIPVANAPTWREHDYGVSGGVTFPALGFAQDDYVHYVVQTQHGVKILSDMQVHCHFTLPSAAPDTRYIAFQVDVIAADVSGSYAPVSGSPFTSEVVVEPSAYGRHNVMRLATLSKINEKISTIAMIKLTRVAASSGTDYSGEVYLNFIDTHVQMDTVGSKSPFQK